MPYLHLLDHAGPLPDPASYLGRLSFQPVASGYAHVDRNQGLVRELFRPPLSHLWPGDWPFCTVVRLDPGGHLPLHSDDCTHAPGCRRYHLVLRTNPGCWLFHGGAWQRLREGGVYAMDPRVPHGGVNWGDSPRLHLVLDHPADVTGPPSPR